MPVLRIALQKSPLITVTRSNGGTTKNAYILRINKKMSYDKGKSHIVYIGTTKNGIARVAESAANKASEILHEHGVKSLSAHIVTCTPRQRVMSWRMLERSLILRFKDLYGEPPYYNTHGTGYEWDDEDAYFSKQRLENILNRIDDYQIPDGSY